MLGVTQHLAVSHCFHFQKVRGHSQLQTLNISQYSLHHFILLPDVYHRHRLEMGIPEGMDEIPVGKALPLEYNLDYMNGGIFIAAIHCMSHVSLVPRPRGVWVCD